MSKDTEAQKIYLEGYKAFELGDFRAAHGLAETCLELSPKTSYWYAGALGLKCWIANFTDNLEDLEQSATTLLAMDTGTDKPWFDGMSLLNLGLVRKREGNHSEAQMYFSRAAEQYEAQQLQLGQPSAWQNVLDYFSSMCRWAVTEETNEWSNLLEQLRENTDEKNELKRQLSATTRLMLRYSRGEQVKQEAVELAKEGVSRTFLSMLLLE